MGTNGLGFILAIAVVVGMAVWTSHGEPLQYVDAHGGFCVVAGTIVIMLISVPFADVKKFLSLIRVVATKEREDRIVIVNQFVEFATTARTDITSLAASADKVSDPFFKDALILVSQGLDVPSLNKILRRRLEVQRERENSQAMMFKNLGKYPPACGLLGTVMGMISLLGSLGQEGAAAKIGPSMFVALAATLYGVVVANLLILPVADNLMTRTQKSIAKREMIVEGIVLLRLKTNPVMVREMLLSHLPPALRGEIVGGAKAA